MNHQGSIRKKEKVEGVEGNIEWKLSEVNTGAMSRGQNEVVGEFMIAVGYVISIGVGYD
jgi:hypothetical protein